MLTSVTLRLLRLSGDPLSGAATCRGFESNHVASHCLLRTELHCFIAHDGTECILSAGENGIL